MLKQFFNSQRYLILMAGICLTQGANAADRGNTPMHERNESALSHSRGTQLITGNRSFSIERDQRISLSSIGVIDNNIPSTINSGTIRGHSNLILNDVSGTPSLSIDSSNNQASNVRSRTLGDHFSDQPVTSIAPSPISFAGTRMAIDIATLTLSQSNTANAGQSAASNEDSIDTTD